jgi:hypothetical protein
LQSVSCGKNSKRLRLVHMPLHDCAATVVS